MKKIIIAIGLFTLVNFTLNISMLTLKYIEVNTNKIEDVKH